MVWFFLAPLGFSMIRILSCSKYNKSHVTKGRIMVSLSEINFNKNYYKMCELLLREIKKTEISDISGFWIRPTIVKKSVLIKLIYRFNVTLHKIPVVFFCLLLVVVVFRNWCVDSELYIEMQRKIKSKDILPDFKISYKALVIKTVC